jgi:hypothetical protein
MTPEAFEKLMTPIFDEVAEGAIDGNLERRLGAAFPVSGELFERIHAACREAIAAGWMCAQGGPGRRFGRVIEAKPETHDLSVDVVELENIVGPHHVHPTGEVCLTMPEDAGAEFDGQGAGWCVNAPGSDHFPTVTGVRALVLYLLPGGRIEFTGRQPGA